MAICGKAIAQYPEEVYNFPNGNKIDHYYNYPIGNGNQIAFKADLAAQKISSIIQDPNDFKSLFVYLDNATNINIELWGDKSNLLNLRYNIVENDSVFIAKDEVVKNISKNSANFYARFGPLNISDRKISIIVYQKGKYEQAKTITFFNKNLNPAVLIDTRFVELFDNPPAKLKRNAKNEIIRKEVVVNRIQLVKNHRYVYYDEKLSYAAIQIKPIENVFLYKIKIIRKTEEKDFVIQIDEPDWKSDWDGNFICKLPVTHFAKAGKYEIVVYPKIGKTSLANKYNQTAISFEVKTHNSFSTKQLVISGLLFSLIVGAITGGLAVYVKNKQIKEKVAAEAKQKEVAQLKLNSVRSQLNPHFLFNALAGIQNLMNKNEINLANRYLSKFARLTRNVLESRELVSLNEEKTLLDDYLQMEQLRFGFQYHIQISTELDSENIEIPAMLLQPFIENSVKHGIAEKASEGKIEVNFEKNEADLILKIIDNGKGFDEGKTYSGLGLSLSKNRISLLNTIYKDTPFVLGIQSDSSGTIVTVTLTQWL